MKKSILSLLAMVAMVCTFASCNKTAQKSDTNDELSAMSDSVAMIQGYLTGQQFGQQFMMMAMQGMPVDLSLIHIYGVPTDRRKVAIASFTSAMLMSSAPTR